MPPSADSDIAQDIGEKLKLGIEVLERVGELYDDLGDFDTPRSYRIDQKWDLVVRPGWNRLNPTALSNYVFLANRRP